MNRLKTQTLSLFLAFILIAGTVTAIYPSLSFIVEANAQAQPYYDGMDRYDDRKSYDKRSYGNHNGYYESQYQPSYKPDYKPAYSSYDGKDDSRDKSFKDSSSKSVDINKINCINTNLNINGNNTGDVNIGNKGLTTENSFENYGEKRNNNGYYADGYNNKNHDKNIDCIINNNNTNTNIISGEGNQTVPTTGSLTVNKEIYGCNNFLAPTFMNCGSLQNDDPRWILCDDPPISNTEACQLLTEDLFDIEVLDDQGNQIAQFEGSAHGTTIGNLEPGTYTVNETKAASTINQLGYNDIVESRCINKGFTDGGIIQLQDTVAQGVYNICFEYEDEQGNDCSTVTLAAGEERTCTVKNYILEGQTFD